MNYQKKAISKINPLVHLSTKTFCILPLFRLVSLYPFRSQKLKNLFSQKYFSLTYSLNAYYFVAIFNCWCVKPKSIIFTIINTYFFYQRHEQSYNEKSEEKLVKSQVSYQKGTVNCPTEMSCSQNNF